ncbi:hypothetical protein L208DRAFT_1258620 [Tricholoma matsutake]|nr:hypothetical protein L208DRAFT_1258620 [Tricholoma matsutake 945]
MNILDASKFTDFDLGRLQNLTLPSHSMSSLTSPSALHICSNPLKSHCFLGAPFAMSYTCKEDDSPTIIDTFAPRPLTFDLSPTSSASSDLDSLSSHSSFPRSSFDAFVATRSRVVRLYNLPAGPEEISSTIFLPQSYLLGSVPVPVTMWILREEYAGPRCDSVWAVYRTHEEASAALSLSGPVLSVAPALESDLEPFHKLRRFAPLPTRSQRPQLRISSSYSDLPVATPVSVDYPISSNPPNPRTSFRLGDWICSSPKCAAHNFGRNLACIGCGCPRSAAVTASSQQQQQSTRATPSPRFASLPTQSSAPLASAPQAPYSYPSQHASLPAPSQKSAHPLLTPSGRAFAVGGKVQNISSDPLSPCIMYWPDNEPFPEQGQIRPSGLVGVPQPPILNTGNRGPISHQPGDWICLKCNYLNWRRRKVCQTCLPYAEGNGDSISAAVQAERIALLTSVLAQQTHNSANATQPSQTTRSHSMTPPQQRWPFIDISPPQPHAPVHRSQSHIELSAQSVNNHPIYQTSGHRQPSPLYSTGPDVHHMPVHTPAPLLPSFLQDIVQSPALSPTSTSSADLSFEEYDELTSPKSILPRHSGDDSPTSPALGNIWRLDGEESKSLSAFALPNRQDLMGVGRKSGRE